MTKKKITKEGIDRIIIFVDDLDRLNPEVAVELLEVMKLFMDVEHCVFVLAIDYEVVVKGIRKKYGNELSDDKCRSFFDKIIQLPFRMPVEAYEVKRFIEEQLPEEVLGEYLEEITRLLKKTLGNNPRTLKRVVNSFELLRVVNRKKNQINFNSDTYIDINSKEKNALIITNLILQMYLPRAYEKLLDMVINSGDSKEILKELIKEGTESYFSEEEDVNVEEIKEIIRYMEEIKKVIESNIKEKEEKVFSLMADSMTLSFITNVTKEKVDSRSTAVSINYVIFKGKLHKVSSAAEALEKTITLIFEKNEPKIPKILEKCGEFIKKGSSADVEKKSIFRAKREIKISGQTYCIGTSSWYRTKFDQINKICFLLDLDKSDVIWGYDEKLDNEKKKLEPSPSSAVYMSEPIENRKWQTDYRKAKP